MQPLRVGILMSRVRVEEKLLLEQLERSRIRPAGERAGLWVTAPGDPDGYAHDLYASLRWLDEGGCDRILLETLPDGPEWSAIRDRVGRATAAS